MRRLLVDTGPLVALTNARDRRHAEAADFFSRFDGALVTTVAVVTEVCALLPRHLGSRFLHSIKDSLFALVHIPEQELPALAALMDKYAGRPMDFTDAGLLWLSEASGIRDIATLDAGFAFYRTARGRALRNRFG